MDSIDYLIDDIKEFIENIFLSGFENISSKDMDKLKSITSNSINLNMLHLSELLKTLHSCIITYHNENNKKRLMDTVCQLDFYVKYIQR